MVAWPPIFFFGGGGVNANSSKTVNDMDFKIDVHVSRNSPDITPLKYFQKGAWPGSRDPLNFWALNANTFKTVKVTVFKFDAHVSRDSMDMTP